MMNWRHWYKPDEGRYESELGEWQVGCDVSEFTMGKTYSTEARNNLVSGY